MVSEPLTYADFEQQLPVLPSKREYVDDYRMLMDKYRYKWAGYLAKANKTNATDECDYQCAAGCFTG
jgi:hypothetical protein